MKLARMMFLNTRYAKKEITNKCYIRSIPCLLTSDFRAEKVIITGINRYSDCDV